MGAGRGATPEICSVDSPRTRVGEGRRWEWIQAWEVNKAIVQCGFVGFGGVIFLFLTAGLRESRITFLLFLYTSLFQLPWVTSHAREPPALSASQK